MISERLGLSEILSSGKICINTSANRVPEAKAIKYDKYLENTLSLLNRSITSRDMRETTSTAIYDSSCVFIFSYKIYVPF